MTSDFDRIINRKNSSCLKWDALGEYYGDEGLLPLWVADMDFQSPPAVIEALAKRVDHGIYGYAGNYPEYFTAVSQWMRKRYAWDVKEEWIYPSPGVIPALTLMISALSQPGDKVIIQPPVYPPFIQAVSNCGRQLLYNPLSFHDGRYTPDYKDLELKMQDNRARLMILCSPHNPVGRVWQREELAKIAEIALRNDVFIISDEIHADLVYKNYKHTTLPLIADQTAQNCAVMTAPSKTFNLAGLQISNAIIPNDLIRKKYIAASQSFGYSRPNIFGLEALKAAYSYGEPWLEKLIDYLQGNLDHLIAFAGQNMPSLNVIRPEGTYLVWIDCKTLDLGSLQPCEFFKKQAGLAFNDGFEYGPGGEGFIRINIACPRPILSKALQNMARALTNITAR